MFVAMDKLSDIADPNAKPETMHPSQSQNDSFNLDGNMIFYDKDRPINEVARWIGGDKEILKDGSKIVGIGTVSFAINYA